jgi:nitrobindin-like protein
VSEGSGDLAADFEIPFVPDGETQPLHEALAPVAFLLGTWRGVGVGGYPTIESFRFGQEVVFAHAGKPVLSYISRSWILDDTGAVVRPGAAESGYWRMTAEGLEVVLAHATGFAEIWVGEVMGNRIELSTDVVARTSSALEVTGGHRLYGLVDGDLLYAYDMAAVGEPLQSHLSARLRRV